MIAPARREPPVARDSVPQPTERSSYRARPIRAVLGLLTLLWVLPVVLGAMAAVACWSFTRMFDWLP